MAGGRACFQRENRMPSRSLLANSVVMDRGYALASVMCWPFSASMIG